jgi:outer membrane protein OmpA-like peptidoglycan-associated protein
LFLLLFFSPLLLVGQIGNPAGINSPLDEQNPILAPDGKTLYFTVSNHPNNVGGSKDIGDIWFSRLGESGWSDPMHAGSNINNNLHNTVAGFSSDGKVMFLMGHYSDNGKPINSQGIAISVARDGSWSRPENVVIPYFRNQTPYQSGCVTPDGQVLVFSAESYRTFGAEDIYLSKKSSNGTWNEPINLGRVINTSMQDVSPFLTPDGKRLYFSSNGRGGKGSFDVFYSERLDDTWLNWSAPVNLDGVNSEGRELFFRLVGSEAFFTTTLNSDGYGDIRTYKDHQDVPSMEPNQPLVVQADTVRSIEEVVYKKEEATERLVRLFGRVSSSKNEELLDASIFVTSNDRLPSQVQTESGRYSVDLPGVGEYTLKVEAPGYLGMMEKLDFRTQTVEQLEMNFRLQPAEVGTTVNLKNVLFQQSTAILLPGSYDQLNMVAEFMKTNPKIEIQLSGHTDNRGYHHLNMKLSKERVEEVKKYLVTKGIAASRITGKGFGGTKPIADNDSEDSRQLNRRVEFTIVKN